MPPHQRGLASPSQPGMKKSGVVSWLPALWVTSSPAWASYLGFQPMAHPFTQTISLLTLFLLLSAPRSRPLSAGSLEFSQPISNPVPLIPLQTSLPLNIQATSAKPLSQHGAELGQGRVSQKASSCCSDFLRQPWTHLLGTFTFTLGGTLRHQSSVDAHGSLDDRAFRFQGCPCTGQDHHFRAQL